ncbi:MAG: DUF960 domain-containing protein [Bacillus cereus]|jgi:hypothetical protein|nr:DUF960 domain-containing protein [Bacillus cereus]
MFEKKDKRFIIKGINTNVPKDIEVVCWELIDNLVKENLVKVDYLQVFEFEKNEEKLIIANRQE